MSLDAKRLMPCEVKEEDLDRMMTALGECPLYENHKRVFTRVYVRTIMSQTKKGKQRTFEYCLRKIKDSLQAIDDLKLGEFLKSATADLLKNPVMYGSGRDKDGQRVIIIDWRRLDPKGLDVEAVCKLAMVCFYTYSVDETSPYSLYVTYAHNLKLGAKDVPVAYKLVRTLGKMSMMCFPDGSCGTYHFVPGKLVPFVEFAKRFIPKRAVFKQKVGSYRWLKSELSRSCENIDDILPEGLGGNSVHIEENIQVKLLPNGHFESRVLESENSNNEIIIEKLDSYEQ